MKKFVAMMLALVLALSCACALADETKLTMGTNPEFPPFEIVDDVGNVIGFDADMAAEIAKDMGKELMIESMPFDSIVASVSEGKVDMGVAGMSVNPERLNYVDFSDVYYTAHQVCILKTTSTIATVEDLMGKNIGVQEGTTGQWTAEECTDLDKIFGYKKALDAVMELQNDKLDCVIVDDHTAAALLANVNDANLVIAAIEFPEEEYAIAIAKNQPELLAAINASLARMKEDGTYDALVEKWLGTASVADDAAAEENN